MQKIETLEYASFWRRVAAFIIDTFFILCLLLPFGFVPMDQIGLVMIVIQMIYYVGFEGSFQQATPGKKLLKIKVTDMQGQRVSYWRALARIFAFTVLPILVSFIYGIILRTNIPDLTISLIVFTAPFVIDCSLILISKKKQSLHDLIAGCLVVRNEATE
ncbi:MAG: RDD family protein [Acidobacteriota bacterium]